MVLPQADVDLEAAVGASAGIGIWLPAAPDIARGRGRGIGVVERAAALADLAAIGYCVRPDTEAVVVAAFQRRMPSVRDGGASALVAVVLKVRNVVVPPYAAATESW